MTGLALPLSAEDNRPIKDAAGQIVSIPEHAGAFAHAMNMHKRMLAALVELQMPLMVLHAMCEDRSTTKKKVQITLAAIKVLIAEVDAGAKLPPATETDEKAIEDILADAYDDNAPSASVLAKAVKAKFRVYSR